MVEDFDAATLVARDAGKYNVHRKQDVQQGVKLPRLVPVKREVPRHHDGDVDDQEHHDNIPPPFVRARGGYDPPVFRWDVQTEVHRAQSTTCLSTSFFFLTVFALRLRIQAMMPPTPGAPGSSFSLFSPGAPGVFKFPVAPVFGSNTSPPFATTAPASTGCTTFRLLALRTFSSSRPAMLLRMWASAWRVTTSMSWYPSDGGASSSCACFSGADL